MMTMMIATILLVSSLAAHAHNDVSDRHYHVFEEKDWFRGHLDDTVCHSSMLLPSNSTKTSPTTLPISPVPNSNPYSMRDPFYVRLGGMCNDNGEVCCIVEEEDWCPDSGEVIYCSACGDCMYPQTVPASCCDANIMSDKHQICCKCGPGHDSTSYQCLEEGTAMCRMSDGECSHDIP